MLTAVRKRSITSLKEGFTIFEILIVISIIGLILLFLVPNIGKIFRDTSRARTDHKLKEVESFITQYSMYAQRPPSKLMDLVIKPSDPKVAAKWHGPYLDEEPVDGWGHPLKYELTPGKGSGFALYSYGPDGPGSDRSDWISV